VHRGGVWPAAGPEAPSSRLHNPLAGCTVEDHPQNTNSVWLQPKISQHPGRPRPENVGGFGLPALGSNAVLSAARLSPRSPVSQYIANSPFCQSRITRSGPSNSMLGSRPTTPQDYPERTSFARQREREWGHRRHWADANRRPHPCASTSWAMSGFTRLFNTGRRPLNATIPSGLLATRSEWTGSVGKSLGHPSP